MTAKRRPRASRPWRSRRRAPSGARGNGAASSGCRTPLDRTSVAARSRSDRRRASRSGGCRTREGAAAPCQERPVAERGGRRTRTSPRWGSRARHQVRVGSARRGGGDLDGARIPACRRARALVPRRGPDAAVGARVRVARRMAPRILDAVRGTRVLPSRRRDDRARCSSARRRAAARGVLPARARCSRRRSAHQHRRPSFLGAGRHHAQGRGPDMPVAVGRRDGVEAGLPIRDPEARIERPIAVRDRVPHRSTTERDGDLG